MPEGNEVLLWNSGVEIYKFLLASGHVRGNITESSVAARSGATFRAKHFLTEALI
jgi:predicted flavoprotein YhiN